MSKEIICCPTCGTTRDDDGVWHLPTEIRDARRNVLVAAGRAKRAESRLQQIREAMGYCKADLDKSTNHSDSYSALWGVYKAIESILKDAEP